MGTMELRHGPGITVSDTRRALLNGGDVSALIPALRQALGNVPVTNQASLDLPVMLPEANVLLEQTNTDLSNLVKSWLDEKEKEPDVTPGTQTDLFVIGIARYGRNISSYLEHVIDEVKPDVVAVDIPPTRLSTNILYAFGIPAAVGLPLRCEVRDQNNGQLYAVETFYPGNACQTAILRCWRDRIALLPVGMPTMQVPTLLMEFTGDTPGSRQVSAYQAFDDSLEKTPPKKGEPVIPHNHQICSRLVTHIGATLTEKQIDEANYIASRVMDITSVTNRSGGKSRLLVIVDFERYANVQYTLELLGKGVTDEVYLHSENDSYTAMMFSNYSEELAEDSKQRIPQPTAAQELFKNALEELSQAKENQQLSEAEIPGAITAITNRARNYPGILRGPSVRGTIAFSEILRSFGEIQGGLNWRNLEKAALVTLTPRITTKQGDYKSAAAIMSDIIKDVMYGIRFTGRPFEIPLATELDWLNPEDIISAAQDLDTTAIFSDQETGPAKNPQANMVIAEDNLQEIPGNPSSDDSARVTQDSQHAASAARIARYLMDKLEEKLARGEITPDQYQREKHKLQEILNAASYLSSQTTGKELTRTAFELMDVQDRHWGKHLNFQDIYVYYHIKGNCEGKDLSPPKQNYYGLKVLIDVMEKQGILKSMSRQKTFTLTGEALNMLLESMLPRSRKGKELTDVLAIGKTAPGEHKHEIRRYSSGDVFRDISVRHSLREIARQRRKPVEIERRDLRVFIRKPRKMQSDIVLCIDTSGSMGFRHKLTYARLAAASLVRTSLERGGRIGIIAFDDHGRTILPLNSNKNELMNCISGINAGGNTNIGDGIRQASRQLLRHPSQNQKYIVLITDGQPSAISQEAFDRLNATTERDLTEEYAILETGRAASRGLKTSVLHITQADGAGKDFVNALAKAGNGKVTKISFVEDLGLVMP